MRVLLADGEKRISKLVRSVFPLLREDMLRRAFSQRDFRVNGARTGEDLTLQKGDELQVYIDDKYLLPGADLVYLDENIAVLNKPAGADVRAATELVRRETGRDARPAHRLDAQTSGLMLFALDDASEALLLEAFKNRRVDKTYRCILVGKPPKESGKLTHYLMKDSERALVRAYDTPGPGALTAVCAYRVLRAADALSLAEVKLMTGRTHQIRAQMAHIGCPVLGDDKYGDREMNRRFGQRLRLCSCALGLRFPDGPLAYLDGKVFAIKAPFEDELPGQSKGTNGK